MVDFRWMLAAGFISMALSGTAAGAAASQAAQQVVPATTPSPPETAVPAPSPSRSFSPWWALLLLPVGGAATLLYRRQPQANPAAAALATSTHLASEPTEPAKPEPAEPGAAIAVTQSYSATRLAKIDIVEALVSDLQSPESGKRRQAIWQLGQSGDSRAIQPLVDLLLDADSQQRSLILGAVSEISARSLKPMNRALMLALQDESPDVRRNAIRDVTRVYELMTQVSQLLQYAASDSDSDVQETAHWALSQLNRMQQSAPHLLGAPPNLKSPDSPALEGGDPSERDRTEREH
jgi:HEAT repeats/PBS lyase HEAT-like repeat